MGNPDSDKCREAAGAASAHAVANGGVELWLMRIAEIDTPTRQACRALLSADELARLERFLLPDAALQYLVARALLRTVLSGYCRVDRRDWRFVLNDHGKPAVDQPECARHLRFNLSHTRGLVACVVSAGHEVGVDVEHVGSDLDHLAVAAQVCDDAELRGLRAAPAGEQRTRFYTLWTLKEACAKAHGTGLAHPLRTITFDLDHARLAPRGAEGFSFHRSRPTAEHVLALAVRNPARAPLAVATHWLSTPLSVSQQPATQTREAWA